MNVFETWGQAQLLRHEGNQQLAAALLDGARDVLRRLAQLTGDPARATPDKHPLR